MFDTSIISIHKFECKSKQFEIWGNRKQTTLKPYPAKAATLIAKYSCYQLWSHSQLRIAKSTRLSVVVD
jgi:hypothetical protein